MKRSHLLRTGWGLLAVLLAAAGSWFGYPIVDPIIGILIGIAILFITKEAIITMWYRLMDAIEPELLAEAEHVIGHQAAVKELRRLRMRWMGHRLHAEVHIAVEPLLTTAQSHQVAEEVRHALFHALAKLSEVVVHIEPWSENIETAHHLTLHHEPAPQPVLAT